MDLPPAVNTIRESPSITDSMPLEDNDVGNLPDFFTTEQSEVNVRRDPDKHPYQFPCDHSGRSFLSSVLRAKLQNGETTPRDWLVCSKAKQSLYCLASRYTAFLAACSAKSHKLVDQIWRLHMAIA